MGVIGGWMFGQVQANEGTLYAMPTVPKPEKPAILFFPQAGGQASYFRDGDATPNFGVRARLFRTLAEQGHLCISSDFGGASTFGNDTLVARTLAVWNWMQTIESWHTPGAPVICVGTSMGNISQVNFARAHPNKVRGFISLFGMVDLTGSYEENTAGLGAGIATAWGVVSPAPLPADADPLDNLAEWDHIPWRGWYASDDPLVAPVDQDTFAAAIDDGIAYDTGPQGHDDDVITAAWGDILAQVEAWS